LAAAGALLSGLSIQAALVAASVAVARQVGVDGRGHFALLTAVPIVIAFTATGGLLNAVTFHVSRRPHEARTLLRSLGRIVLGQMVVLTGLHAMAIWILYRDATTAVGLAAIATLPVIPAWLVCQYGIAALQGSHLFTGQSVARATPYVFYGLGSLGLWALDVDHLALFTGGWTLSYLLASLLVVSYSVRRLPESNPSAPVEGIGALWRFGLRDAIGAASPIDTFKADQLFVGILMSPASLGLYAAASALANMARLIGQAIGTIAYPIAARDMSERRGIRNVQVLSLVGTAVVLSMLAAVAGYATADFLVPAIYGEEFSQAVPIAQILLVGSVFLSLRRVFSDIARGGSRPGAASLAEVIGWAVLGAGIVLLVPPLGLAGVALAVVAYWASTCVVLGSIIARPGDRRPRVTRRRIESR
jgi:O-antigen/teichoic acid export membrane protein